MKKYTLLLLVFFTTALFGCATITGAPGSEEHDQSRYDDAGIKTSITSALLKENASKANDVNVHCVNGHVFLVGEASKEFRASALDIARRVEGVVHVTTHWFPSGTAGDAEDTATEAEIESLFVSADDSLLRRLDVDVWGGHVVLTGIADKQRDIDAAVAKIKSIQKVKSVTSYIALS